jgi:prepilin-type N-terminal cleavage/methylation domain-containing protein
VVSHHVFGTVPIMRLRSGRSGLTGFTLIELMVVLVLISAILAMTDFVYTQVISSTNVSLDPLRLASVEVAARQAASENGGVYPTNIASTLTVSGLTVTSGQSNGPNTVSLYVANATTLVMAVLGADGSTCSILVDQVNGPRLWGVATGTPPGTCSGTSADTVLTQITSTNVHSPSAVSLG